MNIALVLGSVGLLGLLAIILNPPYFIFGIVLTVVIGSVAFYFYKRAKKNMDKIIKNLSEMKE